MIRRHKVKLYYIFWKTLIYTLWFLIIVSMIFLLESSLSLNDTFHTYIGIFTVFSINIIWFSFIIDIVWHYNNLILIDSTNMIILQNWLLFREDIEIIWIDQITKVNVICQWFLPNACSYGKLIIEQQRTETRPLFFIPQPYIILNEIRDRMWRKV